MDHSVVCICIVMVGDFSNGCSLVRLHKIETRYIRSIDMICNSLCADSRSFRDMLLVTCFMCALCGHGSKTFN